MWIAKNANRLKRKNYILENNKKQFKIKFEIY